MSRDFAEMLLALSAEGAEFLLVGAQAMAVHGYPRATGDMDLWIRPSPDNARRVIAALRQFGAPLEQLTEGDLTTADTVFQIGVRPHRIDMLTSIDGIRFDEAWACRIQRELLGVQVPVIGRAELIRNKRSTGRSQDLADAEALERAEDTTDR